jgi:hypothetical protein
MGIFSLFSSRKAAQPTDKVVEIAQPQSIQAMDSQSYLASDEKEWLTYLSQALRTYRKPGVSLKEEHQQWLAARGQSRAMQASNVRSAASN